MGFSSGASSAKRKAKKAAAEEYLKAFRKIKGIPEVNAVSAKNSKEIEETLGDNTAFRTRYMAKKADKQAKEFNKDEGYKEAVRNYNDRYEILKRQMANQSTTRYVVAEEPEPSKTGTGIFGINSRIGLVQQPQPNSLTSIAGLSALPKKMEPVYTTNTLTTKEEALAAAKPVMDKYNIQVDKNAKQNVPAGFGNLLFGQQNSQPTKASDPSVFVREQTFQPFGVLYRNLPLAESAATDMTSLSKAVKDSAGNATLDKYVQIANKLKSQVKRDARNIQPVNNNQSLVAGELASSKPYTETIA